MECWGAGVRLGLFLAGMRYRVGRLGGGDARGPVRRAEVPAVWREDLCGRPAGKMGAGLPLCLAEGWGV